MAAVLKYVKVCCKEDNLKDGHDKDHELNLKKWRFLIKYLSRLSRWFCELLFTLIIYNTCLKENSCKKNAEVIRNGLGQLGIGHDIEESS